jgi:hypothetical protein
MGRASLQDGGAPESWERECREFTDAAAGSCAGRRLGVQEPLHAVGRSCPDVR